MSGTERHGGSIGGIRLGRLALGRQDNKNNAGPSHLSSLNSGTVAERKRQTATRIRPGSGIRPADQPKLLYHLLQTSREAFFQTEAPRAREFLRQGFFERHLGIVAEGFDDRLDPL